MEIAARHPGTTFGVLWILVVLGLSVAMFRKVETDSAEVEDTFRPGDRPLVLAIKSLPQGRSLPVSAGREGNKP